MGFNSAIKGLIPEALKVVLRPQTEVHIYCVED